MDYKNLGVDEYGINLTNEQSIHIERRNLACEYDKIFEKVCKCIKGSSEHRNLLNALKTAEKKTKKFFIKNKEMYAYSL